jgi:MFS family permease
VVTLLLASDVKHLPLVTTGWLISFKQLSGQFKLFLLAAFVLSVGSLPVAVMLLKTGSIGVAIADVPLFYVVYNISYTGLSVSASKLSDRVGPRLTIFLGYLVLLLSYTVLALALSVLVLLIGFLLLGIFSRADRWCAADSAAARWDGSLRPQASVRWPRG